MPGLKKENEEMLRKVAETLAGSKFQGEQYDKLNKRMTEFEAGTFPALKKNLEDYREGKDKDFNEKYKVVATTAA